MIHGLGSGSTQAFFAKELSGLDLRDRRLSSRCHKIYMTLQEHLGSCIRRLFLDVASARQAYDFF